MSDELQIPPAIAEIAAESGYSPMPPSTEKPDDDEPKIYSSEQSDLRKLAREVSESRGSPEPDVIDRSYKYLGGDRAGQAVESNLTLDLNRASDDLKNVREAELQSEMDAQAQQLADAIDAARNPQPVDEIQRAREEFGPFDQQQQHPQTEQHPGVDPVVAEAMKHPAIAAALKAEVDQVHAAVDQVNIARDHYAKSTMAAAQMAAAALVASVPELQGISPDKFEVALQLIERQDPNKANAIRNHFGRVERLYAEATNARAQQAQLEQQQLKNWTQVESQRFDAWTKSNPQNAERVRSIMPHAPEILAEYGIGRPQLEHLIRTQPLLNSFAGQQILLDAMSYRHAMKTATQAAAKPAPQFQRPGTSTDHIRNSAVDSAVADFRANPNPKTAARMLVARRAAR